MFMLVAYNDDEALRNNKSLHLSAVYGYFDVYNFK